MACPSCGAGLHWECKSDPCCCSSDPAPVAEEENDRTYKRRFTRDSNLKDQQSTGRKRAARDYPLDRTAPCEWQGLRFAGGGKDPIVGCSQGLQQARHHGPDKNTLNNGEGNVHRICHKCHNRWHTLNDVGYVERVGEAGYGAAHDATTKAGMDDLVESEMYWQRNKTIKVHGD